MLMVRKWGSGTVATMECAGCGLRATVRASDRVPVAVAARRIGWDVSGSEGQAVCANCQPRQQRTSRGAVASLREIIAGGRR